MSILIFQSNELELQALLDSEISMVIQGICRVRKILLFGLIISAFGCTTSVRSLVDPKIQGVHAKIDQNPMLSAEEKSFAKRYYDIMIVEWGYIEELTAIKVRLGASEPYERQKQQNDVYQKWLIGDGPFTLHEIAYLNKLEFMVPMWEEWQKRLAAVDMNKLDPETQLLLEKVHKDFGPGPINWRMQLIKMHGLLTCEMEEYCETIFVLTGHDEMTDTEFIALRNL
jgi:hypothetical protein